MALLQGPVRGGRYGNRPPDGRPACEPGPPAQMNSAPGADRLNERPSPHVPRLTGRCDHTVPECAIRVDLLALGHGEGNRHVGELVIPKADDHVRAPAEARVDRALSEEQAEGRVVRGS